MSDLNGNGISDPNDSKPLSNFVDALKTGGLYVQVHTNRFDSSSGFPGELRGQILADSASPTATTPEPSGVLGLAAITHNKRAQRFAAKAAHKRSSKDCWLRLINGILLRFTVARNRSLLLLHLLANRNSLSCHLLVSTAVAISDCNLALITHKSTDL